MRVRATKAIKATKKYKGAKTGKEPLEVPYVEETSHEVLSLAEQLHVMRFSLDRERRAIQDETNRVEKLINNLNGFGIPAEDAVVAAEEYLYGK